VFTTISWLQVFLHPKGHIIGADDIGLVICWDLHTAYAISKFGDQHIEKKKWRKTKGLSTIELQKYRTGPIVDTHVAEHDRTAEHISYTAVNAESLESRMKSEICSRLPEGTKHGSQESKQETEGSRQGAKESRHGAEGSRHGAEGSRHGAEGSRHGAEGSRHGAEGSRHGAEGSRHGNDDAIESGEFSWKTSSKNPFLWYFFCSNVL
jgi:hypothetical protein